MQTTVNDRQGFDDEIPIGDVVDHGNGNIGDAGPSNFLLGVDRIDDHGRVSSITREDENGECHRCEPSSECVRRFLTKVWFSLDEIGDSWREMRGNVRARLLMAPSIVSPSNANAVRG